MFGREWELQTPMGRFRLIRSRGEAEFKPSENDRWALLFFTKCAFETNPDARYAMLALRARIECTQFDPQRAEEYFSPTECREMERWLEFALNSGEIRFVPLEPVRTRVVAAQQQRPYTPPKPSVVEEEDHFIGLRLKDSKKQPVRNSRVRFTFPDGTQKEAKTNSAGEVLVKGIAVTGNAKIELLDVCTPGGSRSSGVAGGEGISRQGHGRSGQRRAWRVGEVRRSQEVQPGSR
jgi:hypothetical protein